MKLLGVIALLALPLSLGEGVRLDPDGVRIGDGLIQGKPIRYRSTPGGPVLVSGSTVEPLARSLEIAVAHKGILVVEPGVRVTLEGKAYTLSTYAGKGIRIQGAHLLTAPVPLVREAKGWIVGKDLRIAGDRLQARLSTPPVQDLPKPRKKGQGPRAFSVVRPSHTQALVDGQYFRHLPVSPTGGP